MSPRFAFDHPARIAAARKEMAAAGVEVLLPSVGPDLRYLLGYEAMASERLTMAVIRADADETVLVVPRLEAPRVEPVAGVRVRAWDETEDPIAIVAELADGAEVAAIGDHTWAVFLLRLQEAMAGTRFVPASVVTTPLRIVKDRAEREALEAAASAADRVVERLRETRFSGKTERELAGEIAAMTVEEGHDEAAFTIVASGPNAASPHHEPEQRRIEAGDIVVVDFGGRVAGYHSDTTRTFHVGDPSHEVKDAYVALRTAQAAGVAAARPGTPAEEVDQAARKILDEGGYGKYFVHRTGHGIGLDVHEPPYLVAGNEAPLQVGMTFSIEPGVYVPGKFGMRIEDIVVVDEDGAVRLNRTERDLFIVE